MKFADAPSRVYEQLADALVAEGVAPVFSLMGDGNLGLLADLAERHGAPLVHARHEQGAVAMADGFARFSGRVGVASVTHGPGLSNTGTSLLTAAAAGSPVLLVAADTARGDFDHPQHFDQPAFAAACRAHLRWLHAPATLAADVRAAFRHAREQRGPVVLNAPADVLEAPATDAAYKPDPIADSRPAPDAAAVEAAAALLVAAERPVVIAGAGAVRSKGAADAIRALAEALGAPVATSLMANGFLAEVPTAVGVAGGLGGGAGSAAIATADCVLAFGASLNGWTTDGTLAGGRARIVQIDVDAAAFGRHVAVDVAICADAALAACALSERLADVTPAAPWPLPAAGPDGGALRGDGIPPRDLIAALDRALPAERALVVDAGHFSGYAQQGLRSHDPRRYTFTHQFGAIGQALGIAAGAAFALPGERVTLVLGDGCLMMSVAELDTIARYRLPITVLVMNDDGYGQERHALAAKGYTPREAILPTPDLTALAAGFRIPGLRLVEPADLDALPDALAGAEGPLLVDARIDSGVQNRAFTEIAERLRGA